MWCRSFRYAHKRTRSKYLQPGVPVLWVGCGCGVASLLHVCLGPLREDPALAALRSQTVACNQSKDACWGWGVRGGEGASFYRVSSSAGTS